ncbi:GIY-YIG nuclease family protein [Vibrio breoganii]
MDQQQLENEKRQQELERGVGQPNWIYIGFDVRFPHSPLSKIGITKGKLGTRATGTQNPFYALLIAFKVKPQVSKKELERMEKVIKKELSSYHKPLPHVMTGKDSEWYEIHPQTMKETVEAILEDWFLDKFLGGYCDMQERFIFETWNNGVFQGSCHHGLSPSVV